MWLRNTLQRRWLHDLANSVRVGGTLGSSPFELITGGIATSNEGSVVLRDGNTTLLATVSTAASLPHKAKQFQLDYRERQISFGKFIAKRERDTDRELAISSSAERALLALVPIPQHKDVQVMVTLLSSEGAVDSDVHVFNAASAALAVSPLPWGGPLAAVRVSHSKKGFEVNPAVQQRTKATSELVYVGTRDNVVALDFFGREVSQSHFAESVHLARQSIQAVLTWQEELLAKTGCPKTPPTPKSMMSLEIQDAIRRLAEESFREVLLDPNLSSNTREAALLHLQALTKAQLSHTYNNEAEVVETIIRFKNNLIQSLLLEERRPDGRRVTQARETISKLDFLPQVAHGSGLFQQGNLQALSVVSLGPRMNPVEVGATEKSLIHSFECLPYSRNSIGQNRFTRLQMEIGLTIENTLKAVLPDIEKFGFVARLASEILTDDGGTMSAALSSASLALTSAGVPISSQIASATQAIVANEKGQKLLADPTGLELSVSNAEVVVSGTRKGITHVQVKPKRGSVALSAVLEAVDLGLSSYALTLSSMEQQTKNWKTQARLPVQGKLELPPDARGRLVGFNGATIKALENISGADISLQDNDTAVVFAPNQDSFELAKKLIHNVVKGFMTDSDFEVRVTQVFDHGIFASVNSFPVQIVYIPAVELNAAKLVDVKLDDVFLARGLGYERLGKPAFSRRRAAEQPTPPAQPDARAAQQPPSLQRSTKKPRKQE